MTFVFGLCASVYVFLRSADFVIPCIIGSFAYSGGNFLGSVTVI